MGDITRQDAGAPDAFARAYDAQGARVGHINLTVFGNYNAVTGNHRAQPGKLGASVNVHRTSLGHLASSFTKSGAQFGAVGSQLGGQCGGVHRHGRSKQQGEKLC